MRGADKGSPSPELGTRFGGYLKTASRGPSSPTSIASTTTSLSFRGANGVGDVVASHNSPSPFQRRDGMLNYISSRDPEMAASSFRANNVDFIGNVAPVGGDRAHSATKMPPRIVVEQDPKTATKLSGNGLMGHTSHGVPMPNSQPDHFTEDRVLGEPFLGITTDIPTGSFEDLTSPGQLQFSKRGSMLIGGVKANPSSNGHSRSNGSRKLPNSFKPSIANKRLLSAEEEQSSQKVRSLYESSDGNKDMAWRSEDLSETFEGNEETIADDEAAEGLLSPSRSPEPNLDRRSSRRVSGKPSTINSRRSSTVRREAFETAGGIEDWENVNGGDVDRYGFIVPPRKYSQGSSMISGVQSRTPEPPRPQRVSTILQMASDAPRRKRTLRRAPSNAKTAGSATPQVPSRKASSHSPRPPSSMHSNPGNSSPKSLHSPFRYVTNRLPYNKDRRWMDEAGDMLTLPPGLVNTVEHQEGGEAAAALKRREWRREEKWRKMARVVTQDNLGGGMVFEFDTQDSKLISRTWKGIPDRWRATVWHAFLTTSAKKLKSSPSDEAIISRFHDLLDQSSPDDVQIDVDVPRTINGHIMFRRRYRGGQRLLFRVLHSLSLYFPETGYVQGMASSAATLLCYYDEDHAFVMLVRMWQLRGLGHLYQPGFGGLMQALEELDKNWLGGGDVSKRLTELGIDPTSYGTRWYLTLFNYSIPFPAQLRVWDAFMLLGDADHRQPASAFAGELDVLHATSTALIDGTRDILLDSDFENAMKVLTSWIPIKDEELLMKVAKAEWKLRKSKRSRGSTA